MIAKATLTASIVVISLVGLRYAKLDLSRFVDQFGGYAPLITIPIQAAVAISPFPSGVLCAANGAVYGYANGVLFSWIGWWISSLVEFHLARVACREFDVQQRKESLPTWVRDMPAGHPIFQIGLRQIPGVGGHFVTLAAAAMNVSWRRYALLSAIAVFPGALVMPAIGAGAVAS